MTDPTKTPAPKASKARRGDTYRANWPNDTLSRVAKTLTGTSRAERRRSARAGCKDARYELSGHTPPPEAPKGLERPALMAGERKHPRPYTPTELMARARDRKAIRQAMKLPKAVHHPAPAPSWGRPGMPTIKPAPMVIDHG